MFCLILSCLNMSRDSDWYFSSVFRLVFPACWSAHDLNSRVSNSARVVCCLLISLNNFYHCTSSRQANIWCNSSSLLIQGFILSHHTSDNKITSTGFIPCLAIVLGLWKAVNGCWKCALYCIDNLTRLVMLYRIFDPCMILQLFFVCFKLVNVFWKFFYRAF